MNRSDGHLFALKDSVQTKDVEKIFIDNRAAVHHSAQIEKGCVIEPFAVIGENVHMGEGTRICAHAVVDGPVKLGKSNVVHPFARIGGSPQDLRYKGEDTSLVIGDRNEFREYVTVNRGTVHGGGQTVIGDDNLIMVGCHVAHDCILGNHVVMANNATLAGHVQVGNYAVFGGMVGVGAFVRIGESAMLAAGSMLERDLTPFCLAAGDRARLAGVNKVGLQRRKIIKGEAGVIKKIFKALKTRGCSIEEIISTFKTEVKNMNESRRMIKFFKEAKRGIVR